MNALKAAASQISHGDISSLSSSSKPATSVSFWITRLCSESYSENDLDGIAELVEAVNLQSTGPVEASRQIRKKLKYGNAKAQLRALTLFKALVENCVKPINFFDGPLVDRIKLLASDPLTEAAVKRKLLGILGTFAREFSDDRAMVEVVGLYNSCGGGQKSSTNEGRDSYAKQQERYELEQGERSLRKELERKEKLEKKQKEDANKLKEKQDKQKKAAPPAVRRKFIFSVERPKIMTIIGESTQASNSLINAILSVDRSSTLLSESPAAGALEQAKISRKAVVRYIQLLGEHSTEADNAGDLITSLLTCNEQILNSLALYDRMNKPIELDSDEELHIAETEYDNDDTRSIRSKLSAFELIDNEHDKLNSRQRKEIERVNRESGREDFRNLDFTRTLSDYSNESEDDYGQDSNEDENDPFGDSNGVAATPTTGVERLDWRAI